MNTYNKLNDVYGKVHVQYEEVIKKGICCSRSTANRSSLCAAVWLIKLRFLCPVAVLVRPKSLSSSGRFLCPVVVHVRLKSLSLSGLSSAELAPSAIPNERATPQSSAPNSSQCSKYTMADVIGLA